MYVCIMMYIEALPSNRLLFGKGLDTPFERTFSNGSSGLKSTIKNLINDDLSLSLPLYHLYLGNIYENYHFAYKYIISSSY